MALPRPPGALLVFLIAILRALDPSAGQDSCSQVEIDALEAFREGINSALIASWSRNSTGGGSCCQWIGVRCSSSLDPVFEEGGIEYRVQEIRLSGLKLKGNVGNSLARLRALQHLDLSNNALSGSFSADFSWIPRLQWLDVSMNNLSGPVLAPGSFQAAKYLNLSNNAFSGAWNFSGGSDLQVLDLSNNAFRGKIFESLCVGNGSQLQTLNFSGNVLSGEIPASITRCRALENIEGEFNMIQGRIPPFLAELQSLRSLRLSSNMLNGSVPDELRSLPKLEEFWLDTNFLEGDLTLAEFRSLRVFSARENRFSGNVSIDCTRMNFTLTYLDLSFNSLTGRIPATIAQCFRLETLVLTGNLLEGQIPPELGSLKNLSTLILSKNNLVGVIPLESLQGCSSLVTLVLSKNSFSGTLELPSNSSGFQNLQLLAVGNSNLSGSIPPWLASSSKLQVLDLSWNSFSGKIPNWIGDFKHLFYVDLSNNSLVGDLPEELANLSSLQGEEIDASQLKTVESILFVKHRNNMSRLQYNQVSALPPSIILSNNYFRGQIATSFGGLKRLVCLDLSVNAISGEIPASLGNLSSLESLDLSQNSLSGGIPATLTNLFALAKLNLSDNDLDGRIPDKNQFATFTSSAYVGNPKLCGYPLQGCDEASTKNATTLPAAGRISSSGNKRMASLAIGISVSFALGFTGLALGAWMWILSTKQAVHHRDDEDERGSSSELQDLSAMMKRAVDVFHDRELLKSLIKQQQRPLTNADLVNATNDFDPSNIVGCGGFGLVFLAIFRDGTKVAIKRLTGDCLQMEREFEAEVQALAMADHPNLVTLQGYSTYGSQRLLIYSYMDNGSLDDWLHGGGKCLDWSTRLDIARGAAQGLAYLHLVCEPHIVHRDIKSSNILLDGRFVAHVADFGLARLMLPTATHVSTDVVGTLGYIPPEYGQGWMATPRGDVYSFGVVLLELLSTRRPVDVCRTNGVYDLVAWVRELKAMGRGAEIFDPALKGKGDDEQLEKMLEVACMCINPNPGKRPCINEVVTWLEEIRRRVKL